MFQRGTDLTKSTALCSHHNIDHCQVRIVIQCRIQKDQLDISGHNLTIHENPVGVGAEGLPKIRVIRRQHHRVRHGPIANQWHAGEDIA